MIALCSLCAKCLVKSSKHMRHFRFRFCQTIPRKEITEKTIYSKTILLPKSSYPLKHSRALELNPNIDISMKSFEKLLDRSQMRGKYVLHDGPPYANGSLHFGHAINKFLKDIICRRKLLEGFEVEYMPGWDCHGLPIELKAITSDSQVSDPLEIRKKAKMFAQKVIEEHRNCFRNWGIIGDWDNPYLTFDSVYVRNQIEAFFALKENGFLFRDNMPVYWSPSAHTALAEAELQYNEEHLSKSVFVKFKLTQIPKSIENFENICAIIWTTTPWTLPSNQAIAYSSHISYSVVTIDRFKDQHFLVSKDLILNLEKTFETKINIKQEINGSELKGIKYKNPIGIHSSEECLPFLDSSHVTTEKGTGLVHIAPNHGLDDYKLIIKHNIPIKRCIVDERGRYVVPSNPLLDKKLVLREGNDIVMELLSDSLLLKQDFIHSYPYDWRFNEPVIVRASPQWFVNIEKIRNECIKAVESVTFYPELFKQYLINQLKTRPNWCISRQRSWGVPIPVLYRKDDIEYRTPLISKEILKHIIKQFEEKGSDIWWNSDINQLIPNDIIEKDLKLSSNDLKKGKDIFDIWFDSGISWKTALNEPNIADMYLEGCDQLRGWFQSSLILSVALRNCSPFKSVKIHGFALDSEGKKMSKSIGNVIDPNSIIENNKNAKNNCGSDGFRWWVAKYASDHKDQRVELKHFDETLININRIRLTLRFMIGVLNDFDSKNVCNLSEMNILDKYVLHLLYNHLKQINSNYNDLNLIRVIDNTLKLIVSHVSGLYFTRIKHRLYCDYKTSLRRRSCQTVILHLYHSILFQLAPVLPHIMIEANNHLPIDHNFTKTNEEWNQLNIEEDMELILSMIDLINKQREATNLFQYDCYIKTSDINCHKNLSKFQIESKSMDSDLCELLLMSSVNYNDSELSQRDGITLNGCSNHMNYQLLITCADNCLCHRCRRFTALNPNQLCLHCQQVLASN